MGDFSETSFDHMPLAAKRRIDAVCARFEAAWAHGRPSLEEHGEAVPEPERPVLFAELLHIDLECRRRAGESPAAAEYLKRFPDLTAIIREVMPADGDTSSSPTHVAMPRAGRPAVEAPVQVPGYEVLEELGRGGMGVVYLARHLALNRLVGLKFILSGSHALPRHRERFRREAEAVARLRHPNITQIYDIGEVEGQVFLALEYAEAGSLRQRLAGAPLAPRIAAALLEPLARAVQHAHRQGVVHRDLKPANVLLAAGGDSIALGNRQLPGWQVPGGAPRGTDLLPPLATCTPKLTDFGLARMLDDDAPGAEAGALAGTPSYMAPEQASGAPGGPEVDIWALGATLYELLTGRPPFRAATAAETLRLVLETDPVLPSQLNPAVPRDLETIALKCLEKEPTRRYPGARELAKDLRHYLDGEPIDARPVGRVKRALRWARRRPKAAALVGVAALLLVGVIGTLAAAALHAFAGRDEARRLAEQAEARARPGRRQVAGLLLENARARAAAGDVNAALHGLAAALRELPEGEAELDGAIRGELAAWRPAAMARSGGVATEGTASCVAARPGEVFVASGRRVSRRDRKDGRELAAWDHGAAVRSLAVSGDGKRLLVGEGEKGPSVASYRDPETGKLIGAAMSHPAAVTHGLFLPSDAGAVTACEDGAVRWWDGQGRELRTSVQHPLPVRRVAVSRDGKALAAALGDASGQTGAVWLWALAASPPTVRLLAHPGRVAAVAFSPGGDVVYTGGADGRLRAWGVEGATVANHPSEIAQVEITPDGRSLLTAALDGHVRVWDRATGAPRGRVAGGPAMALLDGGAGVVVAAPGEARTYVLPRGGRQAAAAAKGSALELTREVEWVTGMTLGAAGELVPLAREDWSKRRVDTPQLPDGAR